MKDQLNLRVYQVYLQEENSKWYWVDKPQNYKDLYGVLQLLQASHSNNFSLKTLKLGWVAFHSVTFQLKCLDFFNLINIRNSCQSSHVSAMGY